MTKSSAARRERRRKGGRPSGTHASLLKDRQRFSIAMWLAFEQSLGPFVAAKLATVVIEENSPIGLEDVERVLVVAGADYVPSTAGSGLDDYARDLSRKAQLVAERATGRERDWLTASSGALKGLLHFIGKADLAGTNRSLAILEQAGWTEVLARVERRIDSALKSNFPPFEGRLSAAARRLLEARQRGDVVKTQGATTVCDGG